MSVGSGIFYGCALIALVLLYLKTREQWNWKKLGLVGLATLIVLPAFVFGAIYLENAWNARPLQQTSYWDIALGAPEADVIFRKGKPSEFTGNKVPPNQWSYAYGTDGEFVPKVDIGTIVKEVFVIKFKDRKVVRVGKHFGDMPYFSGLGGIGGQSSPDDAIATLGQPSHVSRSKDELRRVYSFDRYNVALSFERGTMNGQVVYDPKEGPIRFGEESMVP